MTARAIMRLLPEPPARVSAERLQVAGRDLLRLDERAMRAVRGNLVAMIFQEPMTSLNPTWTVGYQIEEGLRLHTVSPAAARRARALDLLRRVGVGAPERRLAQYPFELSGGLRQRVMIAMALACSPRLLIADEPTTALDVTVQAQILDLLAGLRDELGMAILLITHDLGVVAEMCDEVAVMYAGRIVEQAPVVELFARPRHPYTAGLLAAMPRLDRGRGRLADDPRHGAAAGLGEPGCIFRPRCAAQHPALRRRDAACSWRCDGPRRACWNPAVIGDGTALLEVEDLVTSFPLKGGGRIQAVNGVSLELRRGETLAVVGESGCGKSTLARSVLRLVEPSAGRVRFAGQDVLALGRDGLRRLRRDMQLVFQDPMASLDPRFTVGRSLLEPFVVHGVGRSRSGAAGRRAAAHGRPRGRRGGPLSARILRRPAPADRDRPRDRARARLVVLDEPVSALDVSIQSQILNLLQDLKERLHSPTVHLARLGVVHAIADRVAVMYLGRSWSRPRSNDSSAPRRTPTPRPCSRPCPSPTPVVAGRVSLRMASRPAPSIRPRAARFILDACTRYPSAGYRCPSPRTCPEADTWFAVISADGRMSPGWHVLQLNSLEAELGAHRPTDQLDMVVHQPLAVLGRGPFRAGGTPEAGRNLPAPDGIVGRELGRAVVRHLAHVDEVGPEQQHQRGLEQARMLELVPGSRPGTAGRECCGGRSPNIPAASPACRGCRRVEARAGPGRHLRPPASNSRSGH